MNTMNRGSIVGAIVLIGMGVLFLVFNLLGVTLTQTWPIIFFGIGAVFFLPALIWPSLRSGLASLYIPGVIMVGLGCIFLYDTLTNDWASWAYAWILITGSVGLGLALAGWIGEWGREVISVGWWMFVISLVVFSIFATIFGGSALKAAGPVVLILFGIWLLFRAVRRK